MKLVLLNGGLANQVFQYIFARFIEITSGETCILDDSYFFILDEARKKEKETGIITTHNGYELEKVFPNCKVTLLSQQFDPEVWGDMVKMMKDGANVPQLLQNSGINIQVVADSAVPYDCNGNLQYVTTNEFIPEVANFSGNVYYYGYWINKKWFSSNQDQLMYELQFPKITDSKNLAYENMILNSASVSVHIRRGDYVTSNLSLPTDYYQSALAAFQEDVTEHIYFVFSDDLEWCKANRKELGFNDNSEVIFVDGNCDKQHNFIDMQLMSLCENMIISISAFSYLAALLNKNEEKIVVNPTAREV